MSETNETIVTAEEILDKAFQFPLGFPGFTKNHKYVFTQVPEERPFAWMRNLEDPSLAFAVVDAFYLKPDYVAKVDDAELIPICSPSPLDCAILIVLRLQPGTPFRIYANLRAPVILNKVTKQGRQVILYDSDYKEDEVFEY